MVARPVVSRLFPGCRSAALLFIPLFTAVAVAQDDAPLRYGWESGQSLVYSVKIETDRGDYSDIFQGSPSFKVKMADGDSISVGFGGSLIATQKAKPGKRILFRGPGRFSAFSPFTGISGSRPRGAHEFAMNLRGEIISSRGSSQLPFLLGNLSQLMIERLPEANEKTWKYQREISIAESNSRIPVPSFIRDRNRKTTKANEVTTYTIQESSADKVVIKKEYELKTALTVGGEPKLHIKGEGKLTFDRKQGAFSQLAFKQTVTSRDGQDIRVTPVEVSYRLLSEAEQKELLAKAEAARAKAAAPPNAQEREQILADLKTNESSKFLRRLQQLQGKSPEAPDEEIAGALEFYLTAENQTHRYMAAKALETWATGKSTAALIKALDDKSTIVAASAMLALARLQAKEAAKPIAAKLAESRTRLSASKALAKMGSIAEDPVAAQLKHKEWQVRLEACRILEKIGTEKCIKPLQGLANDENALVKLTAKKTIEQVEKRANSPQTWSRPRSPAFSKCRASVGEPTACFESRRMNSPCTSHCESLASSGQRRTRSSG